MPKGSPALLEEYRAPSNVEEWDSLIEECKNDFFRFVDLVLKPLCPGTEKDPGSFDLSDAEHFRQMLRLINADPNFTLSRFGEYSLATENPKHNLKLGLLPRYHGKTRVGTVAYCMWRLLNNPNERILIISQTWDNARDMLMMIKDLYVKIRESQHNENAYIYCLMGDWVGSVWNEDRIIVKTRTKLGTDPSIATAGIDKEITSKHFDVIICDDLVGAQNITTPDQIEKTKRAYSKLTEVGDIQKDKVSLQIIWGTIWDFNDLHCQILSKEIRQQYDILKLACWDENHNPLFPEKFPREELENIKRKKLSSGYGDEWYSQYENDPNPSEYALFKQDSIQWYDEPPKNLSIVICVDPALSEKSYSCYTAIVPVGIDNDGYGRRYVLPYLRFKEKDPTKVCMKIIEACLQYRAKLLSVGVEEGTLYNTLEPTLMRLADWLPLVPLKINNEDKTFRIVQGLQPFVASKRIYLQRNMTDLIDQMIKFPKASGERDLIDATAYHIQLVPYDPARPPEEEREASTRDEQFWARIKSQDGEQEEE